MSDTPETDAEHARMQMGGFTMDFCRKLERERDEAQAWIGEIFRLLGLPDGDMGAVENLRRERDEAMEALSGRTVSCAACNHAAIERDEAREEVKNLEDQRDLCMKTICRLEKELDQIRAVFGHGANDADWKPGTTIAEAVEKVMRERNEARKLACLYRDQFYAVSMPTVKPPKFSWEEGYIQ